MSERRRRPLPQRKRPAPGRGNGPTEDTSAGRRAVANELWRTSCGEEEGGVVAAAAPAK